MNRKSSNPTPARFTQESLLQSVKQRIAERLLEANQSHEDPVPPGWFNCEQLGEMLAVSSDTVRRQMRKIKAPEKKFRRLVGNHLRPVTHYQP